MMHGLLITSLMLAVGLAAPPDLNEAQRTVLRDGVTDRDGVVDQPGLYALLENASEWRAGDFAGAKVPDFDVIAVQPQATRGELLLIRGRLANVPEAVSDLSRTGSWSATLRRWPINIDNRNRDTDRIVLVYLTDAALVLRFGNVGDRVETAGRFYKVWSSTNREGKPTEYLVFVGRSAKVANGGLGAAGASWLPMVVSVSVALLGYALLRRFVKRWTRRAAQPVVV